MKTISVQICSYNRKEILEKVLTTLGSQTLSPCCYEVVLVDDGSTDGTGEMVKGLRVPYSITYHHQVNSGLATARNAGLSRCTGDIILYIDDDVLADPCLLSEHLAAHRKHPDSVIKGWVNHVEAPEIPREPRFTMQDVSTAFFWTSNVSVGRHFLEKVGGFDESFKEYGWEDLELGYRLRKAGLRSRFWKKAVAYHYKRKPAPSDLPAMCRQAEAKGRTAVLFCRKHPTFRIMLATGIWGLPLAMDELLRAGGLEAFLRRLLARRESETLSGLSLWSARQIANFSYFRAIKKTLRGETI
ncbi:MAG: glycosyltransferase family 2 protein [Armatimonadetes bacterium]|nr:glycosyltransferase family 2 protein [Armatimonadota bacterium]